MVLGEAGQEWGVGESWWCEKMFGRYGQGVCLGEGNEEKECVGGES